MMIISILFFGIVAIIVKTNKQMNKSPMQNQLRLLQCRNTFIGKADVTLTTSAAEPPSNLQGQTWNFSSPAITAARFNIFRMHLYADKETRQKKKKKHD